MNLNSSKCRLLWDNGNDVFCYFNGEKVKYVSKDALTKIEGKVIFLNGHDYDRVTHKCKECNINQPTLIMGAILNGAVNNNINNNQWISTSRDYVELTRSITFGYKSDYINKITGTYYPSEVEEIDIICVYEKKREF